MVAYHGFADIVTQDMVDLDLPELAKRSIVVDAAPEQQRAMDLLVERAKRIRAGAVDQKRDNMLKITGDGRKLALDPILVRELGATAPLEGGKVQACAERVRQMQAAGIISGFTLRESERPRHFITVLLAHNRFDEFERFLHGENGIESADKTSGDGCYHLVYLAEERNTLDSFLTRLSVHGRYRIASAIRRIIG